MKVFIVLLSIGLALGHPNLSSIVATIATNHQLGVSSECREALNVLVRHPDALLQMADSWAKFPYPGALYRATHIDYGDYDECIEVEVEDDMRIIGKYCAWGLTLPVGNSTNHHHVLCVWQWGDESRDHLPIISPVIFDCKLLRMLPIVDELLKQIYLLSYCIPHQCTHDDINQAIELPLFNSNYCSTKDTDRHLDTGAIVTIVIFVIFAVMMIASTAYDIYLYYSNKSEFFVMVLLAFSIYSNGRKLIATTRADEQILCFNGMKFISMWWIISGHGFIAWFLGPVDDEANRSDWQTSRYAQYITTAHISVDTFFYISGFLTSYLYFKQQLSKRGVWAQFKAVPSMVLHRYLRLTPANAATFFGAVYLFKYLQNGPFFSYGIRTGLIEQCTDYWWTYFLYIQNYYNFHRGVSLCIPTTWYLSADFQLFLFSPLVIIPLSLLYRKSIKLTMGCLLVLNMLFLVLPIWTRLQWRDYDPTFQEYDFHSKLISYFMGVMMGMVVRHNKNIHVNITKVVNVGLWALALGLMLIVVLYRYQAQLVNTYISKTLAYSFTRPMWCLGLSWITFACVKGHGGVVNSLLSSSFMQIGAKLTYCIYIVHGFVIAHHALGVRSRKDFSDWNAFYLNCGYVIISVLVATVWALAFELPMMIIEKFIFGENKLQRSASPKAKKAAVI